MDNTATTSLSDLKAILSRRKWGLLLPAGAVFLVAVALAFLLPSIYRSTATILIEEQEIPKNIVQTTVTSYAEQRLQNIYQRIISTSRLQKIIDEVHLYPELQGNTTPDQIAASMRQDIGLDFIKADIIDPRTGRASSANIAFTISYKGRNPEQTQKVTSILTSLFLEDNLREREESASSASLFLLDEANRVKDEVAVVDAKIAAFKEEHVNELPELLQVNIQSLHDVETLRDRLYEQMKSLREHEGYLESQLSSVPRKVQAREKNRLEELQVQLAGLQTRYSDKYPDVIALKAEIEKLSAETVEETQETPDNPAYINLAAQLASTKSEIASIESQLKANERKSEKYRGYIQATPRVEETYRVLLNERDNKLRKYNELMQKQMEAQVAQGLEEDQKSERFTVIEPAALPTRPAQPNRLAIMLIGVVLGVGAGVGTAALLEFSDQTIRSAEGLAKVSSFPVLGVIPEILHARERRRATLKNAFAVLYIGAFLALACGAVVAVRYVEVFNRIRSLLS